MRELRKWAWAAVVAASAAAPAAAQQGTITSTGTTTLGSLSGTGGLAGGGGAGQLGGNSGGGLSGSVLQGSQLQSMQAAPQLIPPNGQASSSLQKSNFLAGYFANPYFQGTITAGTNAAPGGFGSALYGNTGGTGSTGTRSAAGGAYGGGIGGGRGLTNNSNQSGIIIPIPTQIAYTARMQFPTPPVATSKMQSELRLAIDSPLIANPKAIQILIDANNNVVLRGTVKDEDEVRLAEGLVRLTPGVQAITNELIPSTVSADR